MKTLELVDRELCQTYILRGRACVWVYILVFCVNLGSKNAHGLNLIARVIFVDLDPISDTMGRDAGYRFISPLEKYELSQELALLDANESVVGQMVLIGVLGGGMDMSIARILRMIPPSLFSCSAENWLNCPLGWCTKPSGTSINKQSADTISSIPLAGDHSGITVKGLNYSFQPRRLIINLGWGFSNVLEGLIACNLLSAGLLFAAPTPGRA